MGSDFSDFDAGCHDPVPLRGLSRFESLEKLWRRRDERTPFGPSRRDSNPCLSTVAFSPNFPIASRAGRLEEYDRTQTRRKAFPSKQWWVRNASNRRTYGPPIDLALRRRRQPEAAVTLSS